jgi:quercetin dioxygenase-like cupin family protein
MRTMQLLEDIEFDEKRAHASPLFVDKAGRVLCFALRPGQSLKEHAAPNSPLYLVVIKGEGMFAGGDGKERRLGPSSLAILDRGEAHSIRTLDEDLVFLGFLHGEPTARPGKVTGKMARSER